jgi:hypothetical protein
LPHCASTKKAAARRPFSFAGLQRQAAARPATPQHAGQQKGRLAAAFRGSGDAGVGQMPVMPRML